MAEVAHESKSSPNDRYGDIAIALHWISAILVVAVGGLGLLFRFLGKSLFIEALSLHAIIGLLLLSLIGFRVRWRIRHTPPNAPDQYSRLTRSISWASQITLYALLIVTPIFGIAGFLAHGRALDFSFVRLAGFFPPTRAIYHPAEQIHRWLAYSLFGLSALHMIAAFWHHFVKRDQTLYRIAPRKLMDPRKNNDR